MLAHGAQHVIAIERDSRAIAALAEISARYPGRLTVIEDDALTFDPRPLLDGHRARIVANLPYNIATPLLISWLTAEPWPPWYDRMVLMFQREVAERIVAAPGSKTYGRLSVLTQWRTVAENPVRHFAQGVHAAAEGDVIAGRVFPARGAARLRPACAGESHRSGVRTAPQNAPAKPENIGRRSGRRCWTQAGIAGTARAEEIPVEGFVRMARAACGRRKDLRRRDLAQVGEQFVDEFRDVLLPHALEALGGQDRAQPRRCCPRESWFTST